MLLIHPDPFAEGATEGKFDSCFQRNHLYCLIPASKREGVRSSRQREVRRTCETLNRNSLQLLSSGIQNSAENKGPEEAKVSLGGAEGCESEARLRN